MTLKHVLRYQRSDRFSSVSRANSHCTSSDKGGLTPSVDRDEVSGTALRGSVI